MNYTLIPPQSRRGWCSRRRQVPSFTIPPTTDSTLIFHYNKSKNRYDRSFYSSALTHGRMSWDQVDSFLCDVEFILKKKLRAIWTASLSLALILIMGLFVLFSIAFDMDSDDTDDYEDDSLLYAFFAYMVVVIVCSICLQSHRKNLLKEARTSVQNLIDQNRQGLEMMGLRWNMPAYFPFWIELCKDYQVPQMYPDPANQSYFSYPIPQQVQIMPPRPVIQNPIFNQHYQNYMRTHMYQPVPTPQQQYHNGNNQYQPPVANHENSGDNFHN